VRRGARARRTIIPAAGFVVLPWTTAGYALMWGAGADEVAGAEWLVVLACLVLDGLTWCGLARLRRR
jgi:hypothetical protein